MNYSYLFESKVEKSLLSDSVILEGRTVHVALSGGADSVCLLYCMKSISEKHKFELKAVHVNHLIRLENDETFRDENFCISLCESLGVELDVVRINVPEKAVSLKCGLEEAARIVRYDYFSKFDCVATAHNATDNVETVLFHIVRGTAVYGLTGIPSVRNNIIRPLLNMKRSEIIEYLKAKNASYVIDSTNFDTNYTRNYIRNVIVPNMKKINPSFEEAVLRLVRLRVLTRIILKIK